MADLMMLLLGGYLRYYDKLVFLASAAVCLVFKAAEIMLLQASSLTNLTMSNERLIMVTDRGNLNSERDYKKQLIICDLVWTIGVSVLILAPIMQRCTAKSLRVDKQNHCALKKKLWK